ncbi:flagellar hook protein FlgE [Vibrio sp.]|nr:flagellar hook protein FlgE [Vibrio sp.]
MSFNIALTGLKSTNTQLDTISNNIANSGTTGFKESRTEFSSIYNGDAGGGVKVAGQSQNIEKSGSIETTNRTLDLAINGQGFFITETSQGRSLYTRAGAFYTDKDNHIVNLSGDTLQGYGVDANNNLQTGIIDDLQVYQASLGAEPTTTLEFGANLDARLTGVTLTPPATDYTTNLDTSDVTTFNSSYTTQVYDSQGNEHTLTQYFIKSDTSPNEWTVVPTIDGNVVTPASGANPAIVFDGTGQIDGATSISNYTLNYPLTNGAAPMNLTVDLSSITQFGSDFVVSTNSPDGYSSGELTGIRIEDNGYLYAQYSNGQDALQGQVILADFASTQGLQAVTETAWVETFASGDPIVGAPDTGVLGSLSSGALETSNVDITQEIVNLMEAQRNYQANTKTISTSDRLTQALFNAV